ncbi:MAG TPA: hypothetical protein VLS93_17295 [Anaeromyxobacteraceae bacterium]|nr:hypothetical protein [Anaeromyxobacteraceae bacterium]
MHRRLALSALAALAVASTAQAQGATRPLAAGRQNLSGWLVLDPGSPSGIGLGARYMIPVVPRGLLAGHLRGIREELAIEVGGDFIHWGRDQVYLGNTYDFSVNAIEIVGGLMWNWWLTPSVALYPKLDLGYSYAWVTDWWGEPYGLGSPDYSDVFLNGAIGAIFRLDRVGLRLEIGSHALRLGLGIEM